jgi:hypothetical protein
MFELHTNNAVKVVKGFYTLDTAVNFLADYRRKLKKLGESAAHKLWLVDTNAAESYETPNPIDKNKPNVFIHAPTKAGE